jgi:ubiquinol-cytochrome c reductase cytochrome b subunit
MRKLLLWLDARVGFRDSILPMLTHPIPKGAAGPMGWWYVFGSASITLLVIQILTGIGLALVYVPTADQAYESLLYLNHTQPWGWFLRALHNASAGGMVIMVALHMTQVFLHGAFKYPRELTWVLGVILLVLTLGLAFTGQVLRWDADAYWGIGVGAAMVGRVPYLGPYLVKLLLGGPIIGADTLSRFFALHVFVLPGLLLLTLALHLWVVLRKGISEPPVPGQLVDPATYDQRYHEELKSGVPFIGEALRKDALFSALVAIAVVVISAVFGPSGPGAPPDPALSGANPMPDWPFLWLYAMLTLLPANVETAVILTMPVVILAILFAVPFVANKGERSPSRRPLAVLTVVVAWSLIIALTLVGRTAPGAPRMHAWSGDTIPRNMVQRSTPLQLQGGVVLQNKQCRNCHMLEGVGGIRGPDLTDVGTRLTRDELIRQVLQGGGNMPAYGKQLKPNEVTALVDFLASCRPKGEAPAREPVSGMSE